LKVVLKSVPKITHGLHELKNNKYFNLILRQKLQITACIADRVDNNKAYSF